MRSFYHQVVSCLPNLNQIRKGTNCESDLSFTSHNDKCVLIDKIITFYDYRLNLSGNISTSVIKKIIYYQFNKKNAYRKFVHKTIHITAVLLTIIIAITGIVNNYIGLICLTTVPYKIVFFFLTSNIFIYF